MWFNEIVEDSWEPIYNIIIRKVKYGLYEGKNISLNVTRYKIDINKIE